MTTTPTPPKTWYDVSCHCRRSTFKILIPSLDSHQVMSCNCSICAKNGYLNVYPSGKDGEIEWLSGYEDLRSYAFGNKAYVHKFCGECGSSLLCEEVGRGREGHAAVNVRMIKGIDLDKLNLITYDGWNKMQPPYEG